MACGGRHPVKMRSINGFQPVKKLFGYTPSGIDKLDGTTSTSTLTSRAFSHASSSPSRPSRDSKVVHDERVADKVQPASTPTPSLCERSSQRRFTPRVDSCAPDLNSLCCSICASSQDDDRMLLCDACDAGYHMFCLRPILVAVPAGHWFCPQCVPAEEVPAFPLVQRRIIDFFQIEKNSAARIHQTGQKRKRKCSLTMKKRSRTLLPHRPHPDLAAGMRQMAALAAALTQERAEFCNELKYAPGGVSREDNDAALERGGMQVMSRDDLAAVEVSRQLWRQGQPPPLMVRTDPIQGFVVEADQPIPDFSIITEYAGEVDRCGRRETDDSDSLMGLLFTDHPSKDLLICPTRYANFARFISGINNSCRESRKKINVRCIRFDINGEARAFIIAIRDIRKGERLYYDYNGMLNNYPTDHFE